MFPQVWWINIFELHLLKIKRLVDCLCLSLCKIFTIHILGPQVYRYGASIGFYGLSYVITIVVTSEVFLPVFYRLAVTSTYEVSVLWFSDYVSYLFSFVSCCRDYAMQWLYST